MSDYSSYSDYSDYSDADSSYLSDEDDDNNAYPLMFWDTDAGDEYIETKLENLMGKKVARICSNAVVGELLPVSPVNATAASVSAGYTIGHWNRLHIIRDTHECTCDFVYGGGDEFGFNCDDAVDYAIVQKRRKGSRKSNEAVPGNPIHTALQIMGGVKWTYKKIRGTQGTKRQHMAKQIHGAIQRDCQLSEAVVKCLCDKNHYMDIKVSSIGWKLIFEKLQPS